MCVGFCGHVLRFAVGRLLVAVCIIGRVDVFVWVGMRAYALFWVVINWIRVGVVGGSVLEDA